MHPGRGGLRTAPKTDIALRVEDAHEEEFEFSRIFHRIA